MLLTGKGMTLKQVSRNQIELKALLVSRWLNEFTMCMDIKSFVYMNKTSDTFSRLNIYRDYGRSIITAEPDIAL